MLHRSDVLTPQRWTLVQEVVTAAWELPEESRAAFVRVKCAHDPTLLAEVSALVQARQQADAWTPPETPEPRPRRFGPYQLERMIGRGGMGAVYLAHRADGEFSQKVAVKIVGLPFELESMRERFRRERQILADLNHPNITHLIDGGVTDDGELFLAMEYVDGLPLDESLRQNPLPEIEKLALFRQIAASVSYAHQNLVVHRDLKPSNILVTSQGIPKLLDFGTAKLLRPQDGEQVTATSSAFLTASYASPEQLRGDPITTLSDVYSLGAILYEMLTGQRAFPSEIAQRMESLTQDLRLPQPIPGDLDLIVRKALDPEPERRYSSVQELSADVERYLGGHPVLARPGTLAYRSAKFIRRNRAMVAAAVLVLIASAAGTGMTLWQARKAQARFDELRGFAGFVIADLHTGLQQLPGSTALQKLSVERSLGYLNRLAAESTQDDSLKLEVADGYRRLGDVLGNPYRANLGDRKQAESLNRKGLALVREVRPSIESRRITAELEIQLAGAIAFGGAKGAGISEIRRAGDELKAISEAAPANVPARLAAARAFEVLGTLLTVGGGNIEQARSKEAAKAYHSSISFAEGVLKTHPAHEGALLQLAQDEHSLGLLRGSSEPGAALEHYRRAAAWLDRLPEGAPRIAARRLRASVLSNTGWAEGQAGMYEDSIAHLRESAALFKSLSDADPGNTNLLYALTSPYRALGIVEGYRKNHAESAANFQIAAALHERLLRIDPTNKVYRFLRGELLVRAGNELVPIGNSAQAFALTRDGLEAIRSLAAAPDASLTHLFGGCRWFTETKVVALRDGPAAASFCRKALEAAGGADIDALAGLAQALKLAGDRTGALRELEKAIALLPPTAAGQPVSRQRLDLEAELRSLSRAAR
jgi:tetratricopeptide (TPR) repeat protein/predicted Ser/Thr protein kinase